VRIFFVLVSLVCMGIPGIVLYVVLWAVMPQEGKVMPTGPLVRTRNDRMIAGVCGGLARWLGWDSTAVRVLYVLLSIISAAFPGILVYIILAIVMPLEE
jgi:phage shock protein C